MKAYLLTKHGKPSVMQISDIPMPDPGGNQVRVKIRTIGINYAEVLSRKGLYRWAPGLPYVPGMEAFGEIDAVGEYVRVRKIGEKVIVGAQHGAYAEKIIVPENQALPAMDLYSSEENAAFAVNYMTAWVSLMKMARLMTEDRVLITAAGGGVGTAAVQIAKHLGCTVYGTAGSDQKIERLFELNVDHAVNYRKDDFEKEIRVITDGRGVDVILELVGGEVYRKSLNLLAPFGRIVVAGFASLDLKRWNPLSWWKAWRSIPRAGIVDMGVRSYGVMGTHLGYLLSDMNCITSLWQDLTAFIQAHKIHPVMGGTFDFDEIPKAHELMESRKSFGKIVIQVNSTQ
jgi:NADPH2:quinone reductase